MYNLSDMTTIRKLLNRYGFSFSKALGQNFLIDPSVCPEMAEASGVRKQDGVIEIGPGIGVLTMELAQIAGKVLAIELDKRLIPVLGETLSEFENVTVLQGDVLKMDLPALISEHFPEQDVHLCANLPYYITSPIIMNLLEQKLPLKTITVMVQKEAAERLCAKVGSRQSGAVTVAVNYHAQAELLFHVPRDSFLPAPKVDSAVIQLHVREKPPVNVADEKAFFSLVKAAFGQRRKTALNAVSAGLSMPKQTVSDALQAAGLPLTVRAEQLTMQQLADFSAQLFA